MTDELLSYEIWDKADKCPYCGNEDLEYTFGDQSEYISCVECGKQSAEMILTPEEIRELDMIDAAEYQAFIEYQKLHQNANDDIFKPPLKSELVECSHCGKKYQSSDMVYEQRPEISELKFWYCLNKACNGAGYGFDIFPVGR